jgi:hypothetical protein
MASVLGPDPADGLRALWTLQRACEVQAAQAALGPAIPVPEA